MIHQHHTNLGLKCLGYEMYLKRHLQWRGTCSNSGFGGGLSRAEVNKDHPPPVLGCSVLEKILSFLVPNFFLEWNHEKMRYAKFQTISCTFGPPPSRFLKIDIFEPVFSIIRTQNYARTFKLGSFCRYCHGKQL